MRRIFLTTILTTLVAISALQAQWIRTNGPAGGEISFITASDAACFAGTPQTLYRSTDHGVTWRQTAPADSEFTAGTAFGSTVIVGTRNGKIYRSDNGGTTWTSITGSLPVASVMTLHHMGTLLFAGFFDEYGKGHNGLYSSVDGGTTWNKVTSGIDGQSPVFDVTDNGTALFAACDAGVFRSTNNGTDWAGPLILGAQAVVADGANIAAISTSVIYTSSDNGTTWGSSSTGLPPATFIHTLFYKGSTLFTATEDGIFRSTDHGATWLPSSTGITDRAVRTLGAFSESVLAGTTAGGINRSTDDGATWSASSSGINESVVPSLLVVGSHIFAGTGGGVYLSTDLGVSWNYSGLADQIYALAALHDTVFAATLDSGIFRSTDDGNTWISASNGLSPGGHGVRSLLAISGQLFAGTVDGIFHSTDAGGTWARRNSGTVDSTLPTNALATSGGDLYAATGGFQQNKSAGNVFRTADLGATWTAGSVPQGHWLTALAAHFPHVWAGARSVPSTEQELYRSTDRGSTWTQVSFNSDGGPHQVMALLDADSTLIVGSDAGVFATKDDGQSWTKMNEGFPWSHTVDALATDGRGTYAGVNGSGVWYRGDAAGVAAERAPGSMRGTIAPNPFGRTTTLRFSTSRPGRVAIEIRNLLGIRVATVTGATMDLGDHSIPFDAGDLAPGVYLCIIATADGTTTLPMTIAR